MWTNLFVWIMSHKWLASALAFIIIFEIATGGLITPVQLVRRLLEKRRRVGAKNPKN